MENLRRAERPGAGNVADRRSTNITNGDRSSSVGAYGGKGSTDNGYYPTTFIGAGVDDYVVNFGALDIGFQLSMEGYQGRREFEVHPAIDAYFPEMSQRLKEEGDSNVRGLRFGTGPVLRLDAIEAKPFGVALYQSIGLMLDYRRIDNPSARDIDTYIPSTNLPSEERSELDIAAYGYSNTRLALTSLYGLEVFAGISVCSNRDYFVPLGGQYRF